MVRTFGKRVATAENAPAPHGYVPIASNFRDGGRDVPTSIWDGPNAAKLQALGFSPDDPTDLSLTHQRMRAMEDTATVRMNALVAKVNAHIPGVTVAPWAVIPWSV